MHVGSHSFLCLLARLMALWYWKLNVGSSRETYKLEYWNYVKHVRILAEDYHTVASFQLSPTRVWCTGYSFKFRYILAFYACSGNMIKEILPSDTHWKSSPSSQSFRIVHWRLKVTETVALLACIWDFPFRISVGTQSWDFKWFYAVRTFNYGTLSYPNLHHPILLYDLKFIIHYDHNILHYKLNCWQGR
jgi:hypothetical protein